MVVMTGRISTPHQDMHNIDASHAACEKYLRELYTGETKIVRLGERGSGNKLSRIAINEAKRLIATRTVDLVILEDLSRAYRNPAFQFSFAHLCVDHGTRLICYGDAIDTADEQWEIMLNVAVMRHSATVPEVRRRVRRTADHTFQRGGMVGKVGFGYRRVSAEEAAQGSGERVAKVPTDSPVLSEMRNQVLRGATYEAVADWLDDERILPGQYSVNGQWTGKLVETTLRNPMLHGERRFRETIHQLIYATGDHRREKNRDPLFRVVPELAHFTLEEHQELLDYMDARKRRRGESSRKDVSRKRTYWPGQHLLCAICSEPMYWLSRGQLRCCNAGPGRPRRCWNQTVVQAEMIRTKVLPALLEELRRRPTVYRQIVSAAWDESRRALQRASGRRESLMTEIREQERQVKEVTDLLLKLKSESLMGRLTEAELHLKRLRSELKALDADGDSPTVLPTMEMIEENLETVLLELSRTSYSFDELLRQMLPEFELIPVQALDSGQVRPRVRLHVPAGDGADATELIIDAFEEPLQIRFARAAADLKSSNSTWTLKQIGDALGLHKKVVCDALKYHTLMQAAGLAVPYRVLTVAPERAPRWRKQSLQGGTPEPRSDPGDPRPPGKSMA
ncbi:hypothetical protein VT03_05700 [Planctomyces sp. SH-PL14]|nr:hypothetical protein VT03_05700 [Planctomyces sp. SH-PL14]